MGRNTCCIIVTYSVIYKYITLSLQYTFKINFPAKIGMFFNKP